MKRLIYLSAFAVVILITGSIFARSKAPGAMYAPAVENIFVRYDAANNELFLSDTPDGPESPANKHVRKVMKGGKVQWNWRGPHQDMELNTVTPKDKDPFGKISVVGNHLVALIKNDIPDGNYEYNIVIKINGEPVTFDPTIQIHH